MKINKMLLKFYSDNFQNDKEHPVGSDVEQLDNRII